MGSLLIMMVNCTSRPTGAADVVQVTVNQHTVPVIKGQNNDVLSMEFTLKEGDVLEQISLATDGAEELEALTVYELEKGTGGNKEPIAALVRVGEKAVVNMDRPLSPGDHKLVVGIQPKKSASLKKTLQIGIKDISFGNSGAAIAKQSGSMPLRLATSLRNAGDDGVAAYRIPGLATTKKGSLIAVYDIRHNSSVDLQEDIDVGMSRSTDGGENWEPMKTIMDMEEWGGKPQKENGIGDPAILVDPANNTIYVVALWLHGKPGERAWFSSGAGMSPDETGQLMMVKSHDDGKTWSDPINITRQIKKREWKLMFNGPGKGITMRDGTLVFAGQYKDENDMPYSTLIYSQDQGETWHIGTGAKANTTEAQVVELNDGSLMLNMRDNRGGARSVAVTKDLGKTWKEHPSSRSALVEPVCMASLITYPENRQSMDASHLFFSNPAVTDGRYNMTIKSSKDEGMSWTKGLLLDEGKGWGYSCLTVIDKEHLGILYESSQAHMTFQIIRTTELIP
ncbi:BNR/Asp-box repeat protein [Echinicola vietnamensis DSM 17526]|uniref:exo-alpha-sialidase n=2 Tax=Echinicola TaxID=390846 RepID=L0G4S7_ECHVK|nr:BNR/Asp-box repeat protein [Echinicola vietnamensis DSM 17526]